MPWMPAHVATYAAMVACLTGAVVADYLAPWRHVMTPLYGLPVLVAAHRLRPGAVATTAVFVTLLNIASGLLQETPRSVWLLYTLGLVSASYLAVLLARERHVLARERQVSDRRAAEADARTREADEARQGLRDFVSMASHELRTPAAAVLGLAQLLQRRRGARPDAEAPKTLASLAAIEQAAQRMRRLLDDLVDAGRAGAGHFAVTPGPVDAVDLVRDVVAMRQAAAPNHRMTVQLPPAPERLHGTWDRARLEQVLANLVTNAVRYAPEGSEIRVAGCRRGAEVVLCVADQGPGIAEADVQRLFRQFSRLPRDAGVPGMGLGLYLSRAIAEAHGGRLWVESQVGAGSTFYLALPCSEAAAGTGPSDRHAADRRAAGPGDPTDA
jgi:signal transduction histidine kinase